MPVYLFDLTARCTVHVEADNPEAAEAILREELPQCEPQTDIAPSVHLAHLNLQAGTLAFISRYDDEGEEDEEEDSDGNNDTP